MSEKLHDVFHGESRFTIPCLDKGFSALIDVMPRLLPEGSTCDAAVVQAARVSYGAGTKTPSDDATLINYLMRNRHTSVFEMVEFKFHFKMPLFIIRQFFRHRTASINEYSGRYSILLDEFHHPNTVRVQSTKNKQGSEGVATDVAAIEFEAYLKESEALYNRYIHLVQDHNVAREQARIGLPVSLYSEFYWKIDLHNLLHLLSLRLDHHAQEEIRVYAQAISKLITPLVPTVMAAFKKYRLDAISLSADEIETIKAIATQDKDVRIQTIEKMISNKRITSNNRFHYLKLD